MKTIYFIRHAKAKKDGESDFLRKLSKRGKADAKALGEILKEKQIIPNSIYTSTAVRALTTANILSQSLNFKGKFETSDVLYEFDSENLLKFIKSIDDEGEIIYIIGHNSAITEICEILSDSAIGNIPTCGIFGIKFDVLNFKDIEEKMGEVVFYSYPQRDKDKELF